MRARDFCYWLNGYFEMSQTSGHPLTVEQVQKIQNHLNMVFKHEIDPSNGSPEHNKELSDIHRTGLGMITGIDAKLNC